MLAVVDSGHWLKDTNWENLSVCPTDLFALMCEFLVHCSVLRTAGRTVSKVHERGEILQSDSLPMWEAWRTFRDLVEERLAFKMTFDQSIGMYLDPVRLTFPL